MENLNRLWQLYAAASPWGAPYRRLEEDQLGHWYIIYTDPTGHPTHSERFGFSRRTAHAHLRQLIRHAHRQRPILDWLQEQLHEVAGGA